MLTDEMAKNIFENVCKQIDEKYPDNGSVESGLTQSIYYGAAKAAIMVIQEYERQKNS